MCAGGGSGRVLGGGMVTCHAERCPARGAQSAAAATAAHLGELVPAVELLEHDAGGVQVGAALGVDALPQAEPVPQVKAPGGGPGPRARRRRVLPAALPQEGRKGKAHATPGPPGLSRPKIHQDGGGLSAAGRERGRREVDKEVRAGAPRAPMVHV